MGRIRKATLCDIFGVSTSKHRSCWLHIVAHNYRDKKHITWEEVEEIKKKYRHTAPCFSRTLPRHVQGRSTSKTSNRTDNHAVISSIEGDKLDSHKFDCYMESLWKKFSEVKRMSMAYLDSSWFSLYREPSSRPKVLAWIKEKFIFSKKYVFVPIFCWDHWSLLILVHLSESLDSETRTPTPCMLLLDSLQDEDIKRIKPEIRKFVVDLHQSEGRTEDRKEISQIPLLIPEVPQGRDNEGCANYVLYFINLFMEAAPENFSITDGYPYFMVRNWFDADDLNLFCKKLKKDLPTKKPEIRYARRHRHKPRKRMELKVF